MRVADKTGVPPVGALNFQEALFLPTSLGEKWNGILSLGLGNSRFCFGEVWHPGSNFLHFSQFRSTHLLSAYCVPGRKQDKALI